MSLEYEEHGEDNTLYDKAYFDDHAPLITLENSRYLDRYLRILDTLLDTNPGAPNLPDIVGLRLEAQKIISYVAKINVNNRRPREHIVVAVLKWVLRGSISDEILVKIMDGKSIKKIDLEQLNLAYKDIENIIKGYMRRERPPISIYFTREERRLITSFYRHSR